MIDESGGLELVAPRAAVVAIEQILESGGVDRTMIAMLSSGHTVPVIEMDGIILIAAGDTDMMINSGRLSDFLIDAGQEAFLAGWEARERVASGPSAAGYPEDPHEAWSLYTPSEHLDEQQAKLGDYHGED